MRGPRHRVGPAGLNSAKRHQTPSSTGYSSRVSAQGESRRGTTLLVAVIVVSMVALLAHLSHYAVLAAGRLEVTTATATHPTHVPGPSAKPGAPATPKPSATDATDAVTIPARCTRRDNPPTTATFPKDDHFSHDITDYGDGAQLQRLYAVKDRRLVPLDGAGPVRDCDARLWQVVTSMTPDRVLAYVDEFMVFDANLSAPASADVFVGEVEARDGTDAHSWRLAIAPNGTDPVDLALDVAHEVGHLVSLSSSELGPGKADSCTTLWTGQGCLSDTAVLVGFIDDTWSKAEVHEWNAAVDLTDDAASHKSLATFYTKHAQDFVTDYAASDPTEDFAETFAYWCVFGPDNPLMGDYMGGAPTDGAQKIAWMEHSSGVVTQEHVAGCDRMRTLTH